MTVQEEYMKRKRICSVLIVLLFVILIGVGMSIPKEPHTTSALELAFMCAAVIAAAGIFIFARCPNCRASFAASPTLRWPRVCPKCGEKLVD